jgi:hypothetical protein
MQIKTAMRSQYIPRMAKIRKLTMSNADEEVEQQESSFINWWENKII